MSELKATISAMQLFNELDTKMPLEMVLTFLDIARAEQNGELNTIHELERRLEIPYRVAAKRAYYLADGNKQSPKGGYRLIRVSIGKDNHRERVIKLTRKGIALVDQIYRFHSEARAA
ncbi:hypothetical protein [Maritalea myrionectae]|uniref:hypothetical protein n=1 Tax=Maritalea myrionectae TaxID=454601 RepID=UPI0004831700|nr:hypothetical protein [Maritalea myrionectae]